MFGKRKKLIKRSIESALNQKYGDYIDLPDVGEYVDDIYKVILCPVCGNKTLDSYFICQHCDWEYDAIPEDHYSSTNHATLREYRQIYKKVVLKMKQKRGETDDV